MSKSLDSPWYRPSQLPDWVEFRNEPAEPEIPEKPKLTLEQKRHSPWYMEPEAPSAPKWSATKKLKHSLLRRAWDENRGDKMILLIQWICARQGHLNKGVKEKITEFELQNHDQPQDIRAARLLKQRGEDAGSLLYDTAVVALGDLKESTGLFSSSHPQTSQAPCP